MLITRDDIQRIGDEATLLHFLEEKLNLPIPKGATLAQVALPLPSLFLGLDESISEQIIDCQDFRGLLKNDLGERRPFLIRFKREQDYPEILRKVAKGLSQKGINPDKIFFICADEDFKPFAFVYFGDSDTEDWNVEILNIFIWTQGNTRINAGSEHDLTAILSFEESFAETDNTYKTKNVDSDHRGKPNLSKKLLIKLQKIGEPLGKDEDIHSGIGLKYKAAFVIDDATADQLIADDPRSEELIKTFPDSYDRRSKELIYERWKWESKSIIYIPSSKNKEWPWSGITNEREAERVFTKEYPAISKRMKKKEYKDELKKGKKPALFYWEFPPSNIYDKLNRPKIIYKSVCTSMQAAYDPSCDFLYSATLFIPTTDLSLLAILNSRLFDWYARKKFRVQDPKSKQLSFAKKNMKNAPIAPRTEAQKAELSGLVQQILKNSDSSKVPNIEREIDQLVYKLYDLTRAEIDLIEEETSL